MSFSASQSNSNSGGSPPGSNGSGGGTGSGVGNGSGGNGSAVGPPDPTAGFGGILSFNASTGQMTSITHYGLMTNVPARIAPNNTANVTNLPAITIENVEARIDTDGDPSEQFLDPNWSASTNGNFNAAVTPFVAYTVTDRARGVEVGDWAYVTNLFTYQSIWAIVGDFARDHPEGEISEAAAAQLNIQFYASSATLNGEHITITYYLRSQGR